MPRQCRRKSGTGIYHVMLRGINRQDIFEDADDYLRMVTLLRGIVVRSDEKGQPLPPTCSIYAYCLMSNHIHLLLREHEESVSEVVKRLGVAYAYYFNKRYERYGHLFQDRFRSEPVEDMEHFVTLLRYIHQNPIKAGIVLEVDKYPWSSWKEFTSRGDGFCAVDAVYKRIPKHDLVELVNTPLDKCTNALDTHTNAKLQVSDNSVKDFLSQRHGIANPLAIHSLERVRRNVLLKSALEMGAGCRQLSRLTGVSFGVVQKLKNDHQNRPQ